MSQYKYKNVSGTSQALIGFGVFEADQELLTDKAIENPNFQYLGAEEAQPEAQTPSIEPQEEQSPQEQTENQENQ
jgi:hypothetical protein